ncbi:MAG: hypothetical protein IRZ32_14085 [Solirubrobacteraceae bacterium]|nr:hypothetical protein [Solirubrobacteraceae bacterium]
MFLTAVAALAATALGPAAVGSVGGVAAAAALFAPAVATGCLLAWRVPASTVGPALAWVGAAPAVELAVEHWGATAGTAHPWPGAVAVLAASGGTWVWLYAGGVALGLVYPDGLLPGRGWRAVAAAAPVVGLLLTAYIALDPPNYAAHGGPVPRPAPLALPGTLRAALTVTVFAATLAVLGATAASLVVRYRRGDELTRLRLRWLALVAVAVPTGLVVAWVGIALGAPGEKAGLAVLVAALLALPAAVAVAVLRHDLFDIDRLLGESLAWVLTTLISAAIFATVVVIGGAAAVRWGSARRRSSSRCACCPCTAGCTTLSAGSSIATVRSCSPRSAPSSARSATGRSPRRASSRRCATPWATRCCGCCWAGRARPPPATSTSPARRPSPTPTAWRSRCARAGRPSVCSCSAARRRGCAAAPARRPSRRGCRSR